MNFLNPDLYQIFTRLGAESIYLVNEVSNEKLFPSLLLIDIYGNESLYVASRSPRYIYYPYPPLYLFKALLGLIQRLGDDTILVVDTNLNLASFGGVDPAKVTYIDKLIKKTEGINFAHIVTPSSLVKAMGMDELSEIHSLETVINIYNKYGIGVMGGKGEKIVFVFTPTILESNRAGILSHLYRSLIGSKKNFSTIKAPSELKSHLEYILDSLVEPYERSSRYMNIDDLKKISDEFINLLLSSGFSRSDLISEASSSELQNNFLVVALKNLYDPATRTLPKNSLFVPY